MIADSLLSALVLDLVAIVFYRLEPIKEQVTHKIDLSDPDN